MIIPEEPTQENLKQLLEGLPKDLTPLERVILCNEGTVQTILSVLLNVPVKVDILSQQIVEGDTVIRWSRLVADGVLGMSGSAVCLAESIIPKRMNTEGFMTAVKEQKMGIGQILKAQGVIQKRQVIGIYADKNVISRNYILTGDNLYVMITEVFPRNALLLAGDKKT